MKILMIAINDPAGTAIQFSNAINKYTDHTCRLITKEIRYNFMFEKDLHLPWLDNDGMEEVEGLLRTSDVFHFHMTADEYTELGPFRPKEFLKGKNIVHHHHGHPDFRANPDKYREKYRKLNRRAVVSTPDLLKLMPEASWQPNLVPINDSPYLPQTGDRCKKVRVCQSPTRKDLKNTSEFNAVMKSLQVEYDSVEKVMIENKPHIDCLRIKQSCDIHFDHLQGYFGVSSLEGLSQGKAVIAGLDDWNIINIQQFTESEHIPWVIARNPDELKADLKRLVDNRGLRQEIGMSSRSFMEVYWNEKRIIDLLGKVYAEL